MKLDDRLAAVADQIQSTTHVDVGSDHGNLLATLLNQRKVQFGIAVENKRLPFDNSMRGLRGLSAEVRFGDGLDPIQAGEVDSLSICGLGAETICDILLAHPDRIPDRVVIQVFHKAELIRAWAMRHGFHLVDEVVTAGKRRYTILSFIRSKDPGSSDPAYKGIDRESALAFGPFVLKRVDRQFDEQLKAEAAWWLQCDQLSPKREARLNLVRQVMINRGLRG